MKIWAYLIAAGCLIGWFAHDAHIAKEIAHDTQKAEDRYHALGKYQETERQRLEKQRLEDRVKAESRLRQVLAENRQLRAEANAFVDTEFLIYARLCDDAAHCALLYGHPSDSTAAATAGSLAIPALDLYATLRSLDELIIRHNLQLAQLKTQLSTCR